MHSHSFGRDMSLMSWCVFELMGFKMLRAVSWWWVEVLQGDEPILVMGVSYIIELGFI